MIFFTAKTIGGVRTPDDPEFAHEAGVVAGMLLAHSFSRFSPMGEEADVTADDLSADDASKLSLGISDPTVLLGAFALSLAAVARMQGMNMHDVIGTMMNAYRGTEVRGTWAVGDEDEGDGDA
jgi:hypothetical protein